MKVLLDLDATDCRFPVGQPETSPDGVQWFCAAQRVPSKPYCLHCCGVAYRPSDEPQAASMAAPLREAA